MAFYTLVDNTSNAIVKSMVWYTTTPPNPSGKRWLPDDPPTPSRFQKVTRIEPVSPTATAIEYSVEYIPLPEAQDLRKKDVNALREEKIKAGVTYNGHVYDSDIYARANITSTVAAANAGIALPTGFTWRTADNVDVPFDVAALTGLADAMLQHVNACYQASWAIKGSIDGLTTVADVENYDITAGWPV